ECGVLEDPWVEPPEDVYVYTSDPLNAPDRPEEIIIGFEAGAPVSVDGKRGSLVALIGDLNRRVGAHGVGRIDMIENRLVGIKSREIYECPAAMALITAHRDLEDLTLDRDLAHQKARLEILYTELVYNGLWFSPLKQALDAFIESGQAVVSGEVRLKLHKGRMWVVGRRSPNALYSHDLATYDAADAFHHEDARGFVNLWGLPVKTWAKVQGTGGGGK
ncbi:MAG: argininosuccinate synthase, partial [Actinomycetota bacterium]